MKTNSPKAAHAFVIGRFQPNHIGHEHLISQALLLGEQVVVLIGSAGEPRTPKNPFTYEERVEMFRLTFPGYFANGRITTQPLYDYDNELQWMEQVQNIIGGYRGDAPANTCIIVGHDKDITSYYLKVFPQYKFVDVGFHSVFSSKCMDATRVRELIFEHELMFLSSVLSKPTFDFIGAFIQTDQFKLLLEEYKHIKAYKASWATAPYPPSHHTADAVVVQSGHILLVQRKNSPGRHLWALPGGFVNPYERVRDAAVRELQEETSIKVQERLLRRCIVDCEMFDSPSRSLRGRVITTAYLFKLDDSEPLPRVHAADDAEDCRWVPIADVMDMREQLFEDHYSIILTMTSKLTPNN